MIEVVTSVCLLFGTLLIFLAAVGLLRMPDLLTRMHATAKSGALGAGLMVVAVAVYFVADVAVTIRAVAIFIFIILTGPIAANVIGRASYFAGVPLWEGTIKDELKNRYDDHSHQLASDEDGDKRD